MTTNNKQVIEERALPDEDQITSIYGMEPSDPQHAEMLRELRMLRKSDPDLYRKIINLD